MSFTRTLTEDKYKVRVTSDCRTCDQHVRLVKTGYFKRFVDIRLSAVLCSVEDIGLNFSRLLPLIDL